MLNYKNFQNIRLCMSFKKSFPKKSDKSVYPTWEEIELTREEEKIVEEKARQDNIDLMKQCIDDSKFIFAEKNLKKYQTDLIRLSIALFEKRASHEIYFKERKAKEKFDNA